MGFFSDLKEDLSQAVNELMPEEALDAAMAGNTATDDTLSDEQLASEIPTAGESPETVDDVNLSSMLDRLEEMNTLDEAPEEEILSPDDMAEIMGEELLTEPETVEPKTVESETVEETVEPETLIEPEPEVDEEPEQIGRAHV